MRRRRLHPPGPALPKTAVTIAEVERASTLGPELLVALGEQKVAAPTPGARLRERAFALLYAAYDECGRAASYLRWHEGDADAFAPSLFARARKRDPGSSSGDATTPPAVAPPPAAPPAT